MAKKKTEKEGKPEIESANNPQSPELSLLAQLLSYEFESCQCSDEAHELKHKYLELFPAAAKELFG